MTHDELVDAIIRREIFILEVPPGKREAVNKILEEIQEELDETIRRQTPVISDPESTLPPKGIITGIFLSNVFLDIVYFRPSFQPFIQQTFKSLFIKRNAIFLLSAFPDFPVQFFTVIFILDKQKRDLFIFMAFPI